MPISIVSVKHLVGGVSQAVWSIIVVVIVWRLATAGFGAPEGTQPAPAGPKPAAAQAPAPEKLPSPGAPTVPKGAKVPKVPPSPWGSTGS